MKNQIMSPMRIVCCVVLGTLTACEKDVTTPIPQTFFSFMYHGKQYNFGDYKIGPDGGALGAEQQWLVRGDGSIWINRQDIFGGVISYGDSNCTFLSPVHNDLNNLFYCQLNTDGAAVDSTAVYFYKSGNNHFTLDNCLSKSGYDIVTGQKYTETTCIQNGTFDLELINKESKIILITNGKYRFNRLK